MLIDPDQHPNISCAAVTTRRETTLEDLYRIRGRKLLKREQTVSETQKYLFPIFINLYAYRQTPFTDLHRTPNYNHIVERARYSTRPERGSFYTPSSQFRFFQLYRGINSRGFSMPTQIYTLITLNRSSSN